MSENISDGLSQRFSHHIFICGHRRPEESGRSSCAGSDSMELLKTMKTLARKAGLANVRIQKAGCLANCGKGVTCVVYPEGVWYSLSGDEDELQKIIDHHLIAGKPVKSLFMES